MFTIFNKSENEVFELVEINGYPREFRLYAGEYLHNIPADTIKLETNTRLVVRKQNEWLVPQKLEEHLDGKAQDATRNIKYIIHPASNVKKILFAPTHLVRDKWLANIQYSKLSLVNIYKHLSEEGLLIITLIDYNDIQGRYFQIDQEQEKQFKEFVHSLLDQYKLNESDLIFSGGSKAGSASMYFSSLFKGTTVVAQMPQFEFSQYFVDSLGRINFYFPEIGAEKVDFTKYINDYTNYHLYIGTNDVKSHVEVYNKLVIERKLPNVKFHLINSKHDLQLYSVYDMTYQVDTFIRHYNNIQYDDFKINFRNEGNKLFIECLDVKEFSKRVSAEVELIIDDYTLQFHLYRNEDTGVYYIKDIGTNKGYINLLKILSPDQKVSRLEAKIVFKDIMNQKVYKSNSFFIPLNIKKEYNANVVKTIDNLSVLHCTHVAHLFSFEGQVRNIDFGDNPIGIIYISTENETRYLKMFVQKRKYAVRLFCNMREPVYIYDKITRIQIQIIGDKEIYEQDIDLKNIEDYSSTL